MEIQEVYRSYYTKSHSIVNYMVKRLDVQPGMRMLEPCAGDGVFIDAIKNIFSDISIDAYELNPEAVPLLKEKYRLFKNIRIKSSDTLVDDELSFYADMGGFYNRIIANPPYGGWQDYGKRKDLKKLGSPSLRGILEEELCEDTSRSGQGCRPCTPLSPARMESL
jgi:adenine-specific DNA-methyltransferase